MLGGAVEVRRSFEKLEFTVRGSSSVLLKMAASSWPVSGQWRLKY
jgi:hypothetical protein